MTRYARQILVPEVGVGGQALLAAAHILVVGAGGLGCPALQYLAGAGIRKITIIDPDHVEEANLHRQPLYQMSDLGRPKVHAARDNLVSANPDITVAVRQEVLHPGNVAALVAEVDIVLDAADSFAASYILSDACKQEETPLISASVLGQSGYVGGFCGPAPSLRAVFPDLPQTAATCSDTGVLGPVVGVIGSLQAQMALQVLLRHDPTPLGRMMTLDMRQLQFGGFSFQDAPEPAQHLPFLSVTEIKPTDQVIELRGKDEAPGLLIPHATRCRSENIKTFQIDSSRRVVLCCATGLRAWRVAMMLRQRGDVNLALLAARACA